MQFVCSYVRAGRQVIQFSKINSVNFAFEGLHELTIKLNPKKIISSDSTFYYLYDDIYSSMVIT